MRVYFVCFDVLDPRDGTKVGRANVWTDIPDNIAHDSGSLKALIRDAVNKELARICEMEEQDWDLHDFLITNINKL